MCGVSLSPWWGVIYGKPIVMASWQFLSFELKMRCSGVFTPPQVCQQSKSASKERAKFLWLLLQCLSGIGVLSCKCAHSQRTGCFELKIEKNSTECEGRFLLFILLAASRHQFLVPNDLLFICIRILSRHWTHSILLDAWVKLDQLDSLSWTERQITE